MSKAKVRNIGGYEFHVVKEGLDEAEVTDLVRKLLGNGGRADGQHQSLSSMQEFAKKMEVLAAEAEQVAEHVKQEAHEKRTRMLTEAQQQARELIAGAETVAATMREDAAEAARKVDELVTESERTLAAMKRQAQDLLQATQSRAEQVIAMTRDLALHGIPGAAGRVCQELVSMLDGLEAQVQAPPPPGLQGQSAEKAFEEEPEEAAAG